MPLLTRNDVIWRVATIADLTDLPSNTLTNGQLVFVDAYDAGGYGGGVFKWVASSTAATDGGVTFVPDDYWIAASTYLLEAGNLQDPNGFRQLPHTNVVWGSVAISIQDGAQTIGSKWLHGHSQIPRHGTGASYAGREVALLDHAAGKVWGDNGLRVRNLIWTNTVGGTVAANLRTANLNYSYVTAPGRWVREVGDYVTPSMFGARPNTPSFDCSFGICWALNWLVLQERVKTLKFDGNHYVKGVWAEIYPHIRIEGRGMENPAVTFMGDQGGGAGGVADFLKDIYIDPLQNTVTNTTDPYFCTGIYAGGACHFSGGTGFSFHDFCLDGNNDENMYFLTGGAAWDVGGVESRVSQYLRESPAWTGFSLTVQNGRVIEPGTRFTIRNCSFKNTLGSCLQYANGGFCDFTNLRLGNSLSGRVLYGGQGLGTGISFFGYTRSSFSSPYSGEWSNATWRDVVANPWSENALEPEYFVLRGEGYHHQWKDIGYTDTVAERYWNEHLSLTNFSIDMSHLPSGGALRHSGSRFEVSKGMIFGPYTGGTSLLDQSSGNMEAGCSANVSDIHVWSQAKEGFKVMHQTAAGYYTPLHMTNIQIEETYSAVCTMTIASPAVVTLTDHGMAAGREIRFYNKGGALPTGVTEGQVYYVIAAGLTSSAFQFSATLGGSAVNTSGSQSGQHRVVGADINNVRLSAPEVVTASASSNFANLNMDPMPALSETNTALPPVPRQDLIFDNVVNDTHSQFLVMAEGAGSATAVPTEVHFNRCSWVTHQNKLVRSPENDVTFGRGAADGTYNLKVFMTECTFDMWDPGESGRSTADVVDPWIALTVMRNCKTRNGKLSDYDAVITRTATNGATVTISNASPAVISWTGHGLAIGDRITLATTGSLPTGLTAGESYYITATGFGANSFSVSKIAGGADINTSSAGSGTHSAAKADTEVLVANVTSLGYIEVPIPLMWKPLAYTVTPLSANAVTRGITSTTVAYPITTGAVPDNTRPRIRIGCASVTAGDTLTYNIRASVAPPRVLK